MREICERCNVEKAEKQASINDDWLCGECFAYVEYRIKELLKYK